jgi:hypothetical protein
MYYFALENTECKHRRANLPIAERSRRGIVVLLPFRPMTAATRKSFTRFAAHFGVLRDLRQVQNRAP